MDIQKATFDLRPKPPYNFDLTGGNLGYFRGRYGVEIFENGIYRRLLDLDGRLFFAAVYSTGTVDSPRLEVELRGENLDDAEIASARCQLAWILGADDDPTPFYDMTMGDAALAPLAKMFYGLHLTHTSSTYEALVLVILGQQISFHVARMLRTLLIQTFGPRMELGGETYYAFPRPEALVTAGVDGLRDIKFSARKAQYIVDISARVGSGELDLEGLRGRPDEEVVRSLTAIRGVGLWTAHWLLIRSLGRSDGFPHGDLALQRNLGVLVNGGAPMSADEALEYSKRWSPYRSYVTGYLFAAGRSGRIGELIGD